jgi:hypothetical protein
MTDREHGMQFLARTLLKGLLLLVLCRTTSWAQEVTIESAAARQQKNPPSSLLLPPGSSSYTDPADWRDIPPWRQTSFFGTRAQGSFFVFVIDRSGSMADAKRWLRVRTELRRTLRSLEFPQRYLVVFYNDRAWAMPGGVPTTAGWAATNRTLAWIGRIVPEGPTDPREAMELALGFKPSAVFLLSDGEFPEGSAEAIAASNRGNTPIHCIDLSGGTGRAALEQIARDSAGRYTAAAE